MSRRQKKESWGGHPDGKASINHGLKGRKQALSKSTTAQVKGRKTHAKGPPYLGNKFRGPLWASSWNVGDGVVTGEGTRKGEGGRDNHFKD